MKKIAVWRKRLRGENLLLCYLHSYIPCIKFNGPSGGVCTLNNNTPFLCWRIVQIKCKLRARLLSTHTQTVVFINLDVFFFIWRKICFHSSISLKKQSLSAFSL